MAASVPSHAAAYIGVDPPGPALALTLAPASIRAAITCQYYLALLKSSDAVWPSEIASCAPGSNHDVGYPAVAAMGRKEQRGEAAISRHQPPSAAIETLIPSSSRMLGKRGRGRKRNTAKCSVSLWLLCDQHTM